MTIQHRILSQLKQREQNLREEEILLKEETKKLKEEEKKLKEEEKKLKELNTNLQNLLTDLKSNKKMKQYIILQDTQGDGLQAFPNLELEPIEEKDLEEAVVACAEYLMEDYGHESVHDYETIADGTLDPGTSINIGEEIVICEVLNEIDGISWEKWVRNKIVESKTKTSEQEFEHYLHLKRKFEGK